MVMSIDSSILLGFYQARAGLTGATGLAASATPAKRVAPTAPWNQSSAAQELAANVKGVLLGRKFINEGGARLDLPGGHELRVPAIEQLVAEQRLREADEILDGRIAAAGRSAAPRQRVRVRCTGAREQPTAGTRRCDGRAGRVRPAPVGDAEPAPLVGGKAGRAPARRRPRGRARSPGSATRCTGGSRPTRRA